jgi:hypothetical protein
MKRPRGAKKRSSTKATQNAREAIAAFVQNNSDRLQGLLDAIEAQDGPRAAFNAISDMVEYSVPKLGRTEHTGADEGPITLEVRWADGTPPANPKAKK